MDINISGHAHEQMIRRGISYETVLMVVTQPDQIIYDSKESTIAVHQSLVKEDNQMFLLRVFVNKEKRPNVVITLYKTSKISKYYEGKV